MPCQSFNPHSFCYSILMHLFSLMFYCFLFRTVYYSAFLSTGFLLLLDQALEALSGQQDINTVLRLEILGVCFWECSMNFALAAQWHVRERCDVWWWLLRVTRSLGPYALLEKTYQRELTHDPVLCICKVVEVEEGLFFNLYQWHWIGLWIYVEKMVVNLQAFFQFDTFFYIL